MSTFTHNGKPFYKVLGPDRNAVHGGSFTYEVGEWTPHTYPDVCASGYHITNSIADWTVPNMRVWEVEVDLDGHDTIGELQASTDGEDWENLVDDSNIDKIACRSIRITNDVTEEVVPREWLSIMRFIDEEISTLTPFSERRSPRLGWLVHESAEAARKAVRDRQGDSAVFRTMAHYDPVQLLRQRLDPDFRGTDELAIAAKATGYVRDAVSRVKPGAEPRSPSRFGLWVADLGESAQFVSTVLAISNTIIPGQANIDLAENVWLAWNSGYGVAGTLNGMLVVYTNP